MIVKPPEDHPVDNLPQPKSEYSAEDIIEMQVEALANNDTPHVDAGIETAYNFASPENRVSTGPLPRFKKMVKNRVYNDMIDHEGATYQEIQMEENTAMQKVELQTQREQTVTYAFKISKQQAGEWKDCWMTDSVSRSGKKQN